MPILHWFIPGIPLLDLFRPLYLRLPNRLLSQFCLNACLTTCQKDQNWFKDNEHMITSLCFSFQVFAVKAYFMIRGWQRNLLSLDEKVEIALTHFWEKKIAFSWPRSSPDQSSDIEMRYFSKSVALFSINCFRSLNMLVNARLGMKNCSNLVVMCW